MHNTSQKFCVIGDPIDHSLSPLMHSYFLQKFHIKGTYAARQVKIAELGEAIQSFIKEKVNGINVTTPLKGAVLKYVDELTPEANKIGSVNTIKIENKKLIGHNTDAIGFSTSLKVHGFSFKNKNVILFGAGGAARAVTVGLIREQCEKIAIANRTFEKAKTLVNNLSQQFNIINLDAVRLDGNEVNDHIKSSQLLVNSTTVGMGRLKDRSILPNPVCLHKDLLVYDLIYRPYRTQLIHQAESYNVQWINGLDMLICQGIESLKFWLNQDLTLERSLYFEIKDLLRREICQE